MIYSYNISNSSFETFESLENQQNIKRMEVDLDITESDSSIVSAYTTTDNLNMLYDRSMLHLIQNASLSFTKLITRAGDAGSFDIDIDKNASSAFAFNGTKITIKSDNFTGNLKTTGTVSLLNGSTNTGIIQDANGDSKASITLPTGFDTVTLHTTQENADSGVSAVFTGTQVRYQSSTCGGQTLWLRLTSSTIGDGNELILKQQVPTEPGSYNFSAAAFSENQQIQAMIVQLDHLKNISDETLGLALNTNKNVQK